MNNALDSWSVFSVLDQIKPWDGGELPDFGWVDKPASDPARQYFYTGPQWYHKSLLRWLLHIRVLSPSDIKSIAPDIMRHRVIISYEAEAERVSSDDIVRAVLDHCPVP